MLLSVVSLALLSYLLKEIKPWPCPEKLQEHLSVLLHFVSIRILGKFLQEWEQDL